MANGGTVEIDVELKGTQNIKDGFSSISQAGKSLADSVGATNEKLAEGLGAVGESVFSFADSLGELKGSFSSLGQAGSMSFTSLLGPIGAVVTAGLGLHEVYKLISGSAQEAEENQSAMAAAAGDLQSKLEALAEKGVVLATDKLEEFTVTTLRAQIAKEKLQFAQEKLTKQTLAVIKAEEKLAESQEAITKYRQQAIKDSRMIEALNRAETQAKNNLTQANKEFTESIKKQLEVQNRVSKKLRDAAKLEKEAEEQSAEFLSSKIKENLEKVKSLKLAEAEAKLSQKEFKRKKIEIEQSTTLALLQAQKNEEDQKSLSIQNKAIQAELDKLDAVKIANDQANFQRQQLIKQEKAKDKSDRARRAAKLKADEARIKAENKTKEQLELKSFAEEARIQQLRIELEEESLDKSLRLADHRYKTELHLAKNNLNQQEIARLNHEKNVSSIMKQFDQKRKAEAELVESERRQRNIDSMLFDAQSIENSFERENEILRINYERQVLAAKGNQEQITEITRQHGINRQRLIANETKSTSEKIEGFFSNMSKGLAEVAVSSILMGESFKKGISSVLMALSKQAGVEALMQTAKGIALALNPVTAALSSQHFKAAGFFTAAAVSAGAAGKALGGGAGGVATGGGGGAGGGAGIMGGSTTAPEVQRDKASSSEMVFNVNFSGAVIYDTKKAAEEALADRVTRVMNSQRRGNPRRRS